MTMRNKRASENKEPTIYPLLHEYMNTHEPIEVLNEGQFTVKGYQVEEWELFIPLWEEFRLYSRFNMPPLPGAVFPADISDKLRVVVWSPYNINGSLDGMMEAWEPRESFKEFKQVV